VRDAGCLSNEKEEPPLIYGPLLERKSWTADVHPQHMYIHKIIVLFTEVETGHVSIACNPPPCSCLLTERRKKWGKYSAKVFCERGERERHSIPGSFHLVKDI
jgi:hypothetical protein